MGYIIISLILLSLTASYVQPRYINEAIGGTPLIVGGFAAEPGQFPYQLAVKINGRLGCGAALVEVDGIQVAITAAQCMQSSIIQYSLVAGQLNLEEESGLEQRRVVMRMIAHPNYSNRRPFHHDIAIMFFNDNYELNDYVQAKSLPEEGRITEGSVTVSGWGQLWDEGPYPNLLHFVEIPVVNNTVCLERWGGFGSEIIEGQLCAGEDTGSMSACNGDTGGPVRSEVDGSLVGIVSWGFGCGHPEYPGVFTKLAYYTTWIKNVVAAYKLNQLG